MASADLLSHLDTQYAYLCYATNGSTKAIQILATADVCAPSTKISLRNSRVDVK